MTDHKGSWSVAGSLVGVLTLLVACDARSDRWAIGSRGSADPPPVVVISIDTLRSDHLPVYGYRAGATPAIDALARDAVVFERAYAQVPLTLPSHTTILSGLLPTRHGVRDNAGYAVSASLPDWLPSQLAALGYRTGAAVSSYVLRRETGFARGFESFDDRIETRVGRGLSGLQRPGMETLDRALPWLRRMVAESPPAHPPFLFLHLYEPHAPYDPPEPFRSRHPLLYDGEIATADAVVGRLVEELRSLGLYERSLVVLLSDHGEGLGEHGEDGHGLLLYRHDIQVPLFVKWPAGRFAGRRVSSRVALADVAPTILELVTASSPTPTKREVRSLAAWPREEGDDPESDEPIYAESYTPRLHYGWSELTSLIAEGFHYIHGPDPELYSIADDPLQVHNRRDEQRRIVARLRARLESMTADPAPPDLLDQESRQALAALGYLGTPPVTVDRAADPKRMLPTLALLQEALAQFGARNTEEAVTLLRRALDENPRLVDAWDYLGRSYQRLRRPREAIEAFRQAIRLSGGLPEVSLAAAISLVETGEVDEALLVLRQQIVRTPAERRLRLLETRLLLLQGQLDEARPRAEALLADGGDDPDVLYQMGSVKMAETNLVSAESFFRRALAISPTHPAALSDYAVLLAHERRFAEASALLERLVAIRPQDAAAREQLALVRARARASTSTARVRAPG